MVIEDFKNECGKWTYTLNVSGRHTFTVGGKYYNNMTNRCKIGGSFQKLNPTYIGCTTTFKSCHDFVEWAITQVGYGEGTLDKDILLKGNKVYCPELCVFVSAEVNSTLTKSNAIRGEWPIGVCLDKKRNKFYAYVKVKGKQKHLGSFTSPQAAVAAYKKAKEDECKTLAEEYKSQIDHRVYQALLAYTVEIDD